jgi:hypothetical protein
MTTAAEHLDVAEVAVEVESGTEDLLLDIEREWGDLAGDSVLEQKFLDSLAPGFAPEFDPDEAEEAGACEEDALTLEDALEALYDD